MTDSITVLRTFGPTLAKTWQADGCIKDYDLAKQYRVTEWPVIGIANVHDLLLELNDDSKRCIIRGFLHRNKSFLTDTNGRKSHADRVMRNLSTFEDRPSRLFMLDCDSFVPVTCDPLLDPELAVQEFIATLPECFQDTSYVAQLSGSMGHASKAGMLRCHIWYWMSAPLTCESAELWTAKWLPGVDKTVHRTVQANYTAAPVLEGGQLDPFAGARVWRCDGLLDELVLPHSMPVPDAAQMHVARENRRDLVDPREKPGIIGALCRAYEPSEIHILFSDMFEAGSTPERMTWLAGGGSREGLRVTDSGTHIYNSHATAPSTSACNLFDFIRLHVFGHLDADIDPDVLALEPTAAPAYLATEAWARAQPEVQAELSGPKAEAALEAAAEVKAELALSNREQVEQLLVNIHKLLEAPECDLARLEHELALRVAKTKLFSASDREVLAQAMQRKTVTLMGGRGMPIKVVRGWLVPRHSDELAHVFQHVDKDGKPMGTIENVEAVCARLDATIRYNVITKAQEIACPAWPSYAKDDRTNNMLVKLQSECAAVGLPYNLNLIKGYVSTIAGENSYNPVSDWIRSKPWDGKSRFNALAETLVLAETQDADLARTMLRKWLIQCVAVALSPYPIQARGVLVMQGPQYIGKSKWLKSLVPGNESLAVTGVLLDPSNKDKVKIVVTHWLAELGELDATFRKADLAALKAWLAQDEDVMRLPYAASESKFQRRTSMFGSINGHNYLDDETGNTRFWTVEVVGVHHDHTVDMQQLWAEILASWESGETHYLSQDEMATVNDVTTAKHTVVDPIFERLEQHFAWQDAQEFPDVVEWRSVSATQACLEIGMSNPTKSDAARATNALRKLGAKKEQRSWIGRAWAVPVRPKAFEDQMS